MGQQSASLHASSEKDSAYYHCARLEMIHSASILSEATVAGYSLGAQRDERELIALPRMIYLIQKAHSVNMFVSHWMIKSCFPPQLLN